MRGLLHPVLAMAKSALYGYLFAFVMIVFGIVMLLVIALLASLPRLEVGIGPVPLMSFWNSSAGYGFHSEWGVAVLAYAGAAIGAALAIRREQLTRPAR
jgi:hypothetical protein